MFSNADLKRLIRPLILEQILGVTVGMADTMMVSGVGAAAVSGISLVDTINILLINLFSALATGGAVVGSQFLGQKNKEKACDASFEVLPGSAINLAMITVVGQCVGAREFNQAKHYTKKLLKIAYSIMICLNLAMLFLVHPILLLYQQTEEITMLAKHLIQYHTILCAIIWPCSFTLPNALRAASDAKFTMMISILSMWVWRILFAYVLGNFLGLGVFGVWVAMTIDWAFRAICFLTRFHRNQWMLRFTDMG